MPVLVQNRDIAKRLLKERAALGHSTRDEVWEGVTVIMPEADIEHDDIAGFIYRVFWSIFGNDPRNRIQFRANLSDRIESWTHNYRVPDTMLFLAANPARSCGTHYCGGPDIALEVVSPDDRSRDKLEFYAKIGTREVWIVDRNPFQIELFQLNQGRMTPSGIIRPNDGVTIRSSVGPIQIQLLQIPTRPKVRIVHTETGQEWIG